MNYFLYGVDVDGIKLYNMQVSLEKSINPILERLKKCSEFDLHELSNDLDKKRKNEWDSIQIRIKDTLEPLRNKMAILKNKKLGSITDFKQFKKEMILIQDNIENLKHHNKKQIEYLDKETHDLFHDLHFYSAKLLEWSEPVQIDFYNVNLQKSNGSKSRQQCKEVREFMNFLHSSGGHENGWRQEDHYLFIKFRKKFKNINTVAKLLHEELPDISIEDIKRHEEWYQKYINLEVKKRNALKNWQKEKAKKNVTKYSNIPSKIVTILHAPAYNQEKLKQWKAQKEEQVKIIEQIEICNKQKKSETEQLRKKRNEELKLLVQEWKQRRQDIEEHEAIEKKMAVEQEKKMRALQANRMIKQFQSQDDIYIFKMKQKRKSEPPFSIVRSKSSHSAKRDPKRLLKPTQQWINRVHDEDSSDKFGKVMPLKCLPKLGVPEWRRKLD